ncbi:MAG TPA: DUF192 domain-containing protein [Kofleriaceae bacterium]|jgi:hypothetical protein
MRTALCSLTTLITLAACSKAPEPSSAPHKPPGLDGPDTAHASGPQPPATPQAPSATVTMIAGQGDATVKVEVVDTEPKIEKGLMYRQFMPEDQGMLFLMGEEKVQTFWMRNTLIPLDMIFITKDMVVAGVVEQAEPKTETLRTVGKPSTFVLEVNGGWAAAHGIRGGAKVTFNGVPTTAGARP